MDLLMANPKISPKILEICSKVTSKRPKTVIDHIIKHGLITTEDLQTVYGYDHPPRAARDVREQGIPLETFSVISERTGRKIAAYKFGDPEKIKHGRIGGRKAFSKKFKDKLILYYNSRDCVTSEVWDSRYLQIDHRIPYEVLGDTDFSEVDLNRYMLLHATSQRAKSWSCEHCDNFLVDQKPDICSKCFWAFPENYSHVALKDVRTVQVEWSGDEVAHYEMITRHAKLENKNLTSFIKDVLSDYIRKQ